MSDLEDTVSLSPGPEPIRHNRPDFIEIGTSFNAIEIDSVLRSIAETNELGITWQLLQQILDALISKVYPNSLFQMLPPTEIYLKAM
jgi:hypothetical protein